MKILNCAVTAAVVRRAACAAMVAMMVLPLLGCPGLDDPAGPNTGLTGTNTNATSTFNGVITVGGGGARVPADGATDFLITATVTDPSGNPVANGVVISFATTLGSVRAFGADPATAGSSTPVTTFEGRATIALRSAVSGSAQITAWIADVARTIFVEFEHVNLEGSIDVVFRDGGSDVPTITTTAPADALTVAKASDSAGTALGGVTVRFKVERDTTGGSGLGGAYWGAPPKTQTNSTGEAFNTLFVKGVGEVVVFARLHDTVTDELVSVSNPVTLITTEIEAAASMTLEFADGSTTVSGTIGTPTGLTATVTSERTGGALVGVPVTFRIISDTTDTGLFDPATLATNNSSNTNSLGEATNAVIAFDSGAVIVIDAVARDPATNEVIARSNQIVYSVT